MDFKLSLDQLLVIINIDIDDKKVLKLEIGQMCPKKVNYPKIGIFYIKSIKAIELSITPTD